MGRDEDLKADIAMLCAGGEITETPGGRIRALDADNARVFEDIRVLLAAGPLDRDPGEWEAELRDLVGISSDLGKRIDAAFSDALAVRFSALPVHHLPAAGVGPVVSGSADPGYRRGAPAMGGVQYPPDGDVRRWVDEGPPGHVNYEGGAVEWAPGWVEPVVPPGP